MAPANIKKGMANKGKEFAPATILWGISTMGILPEAMRLAKDAIPKEKPIGTLAMKQTTSEIIKADNKVFPSLYSTI
jgi:hypothetical protein